MGLFERADGVVGSREALPGRTRPMPVPERHAVFTDRPVSGPFPEGLDTAVVAMGCFWGAERVFWQTDGVYSTAVGYAGGSTPNPRYDEVCSGLTGHAEAVLVVFDASVLSYAGVLKVFWENHDPTQGARQGNDVGTQYRSAIYWSGQRQREIAEASRERYQAALTEAGLADAGSGGTITTEIAALDQFYYAEQYHQQYLSDAKHPNGYCGLGSTGVPCPVGLGVGSA